MFDFNFPENPAAVAFAGDWHANTSYAVRAIRHAYEQRADVIAHVGDFGYDFTPHFMRVVSDELEANEMTLVFVDGNHENFDYLLSREVNERGVRPLSKTIAHLPRGFRWEWFGKTFLAMGGAYSIDQMHRTEGRSWWKEEEITQGDIYRAIDGGQADFMMVHDVPSRANLRFPERKLPRDVQLVLRESDRHRRTLQEVFDVVRPKEAWAGHYHRREDLLFDYQDDSGDETVIHVLDMDSTPFERNMDIRRAESF